MWNLHSIPVSSVDLPQELDARLFGKSKRCPAGAQQHALDLAMQR